MTTRCFVRVNRMTRLASILGDAFAIEYATLRRQLQSAYCSTDRARSEVRLLALGDPPL